MKSLLLIAMFAAMTLIATSKDTAHSDESGRAKQYSSRNLYQEAENLAHEVAVRDVGYEMYWRQWKATATDRKRTMPDTGNQ